MSEKSMKQPSQTNWTRIDALTDDDIDTSDIPPLPDDFASNATIRMPQNMLMIQVDPEVLGWFKSQGKDFERRINAALRIYAEAHKS